MKIVKAFAALVVITLAFGGGYVVRATRTSASASDGRKILYYVDPMHPAYKSDKPGVAPDCGMTLEPVYADEATGTSGLNPETGNTLEPVYADATPTATDQSRMLARLASRQSCRAIQNALAAVMSRNRANVVKSRLTLMLPSIGLSSASPAICQMG